MDDPINAHVLDGEYHVIEAGRGYNPQGFCLSGFMSEADARLVAAAPYLAEALTRMLEGVHGWTAVNEAKAALAKAGL